MKIVPINSNSPSKNINMKANARWVCDKNGNKLYKTTTYYFRDDLEFKSLIKTICGLFKDAKHVNFINHACSNGMEPFSFIMSFFKFCPWDINKFTPILAKDINNENIQAAKSGRCGASENDFRRIVSYIRDSWHDFLSIKPSQNPNNHFVMSPTKILTDRIQFEQGDILKDAENIPAENTFLVCRNFWGYLPFKQQEELAEKLGKNLSKGSAVLIGYLDTKEGQTPNMYGYADVLLQKNGFKKHHNCWKDKNLIYVKA